MSDAQKATSLRDAGYWLLRRVTELRPEVLDQLQMGPDPRDKRGIVFFQIVEKTEALWQKILQWLQRVNSSECWRFEQCGISRFVSGTMTSRESVVRHFQKCFDNWEEVLRGELEFLPVLQQTCEDSSPTSLRAVKKRRGRRPDALVEIRRKIIQLNDVTVETQEQYCKALEAAGLNTPIQWQREDCPKSYLDAWNHPVPVERAKWRKRIRNQRYNYSGKGLR